MTDIETLIPEPNIIMFGCRSITAVPPVLGRCPSCGRGIHEGDDWRYCGICDSLSPRREAQIRRVKHTVLSRDRSERAEHRFKSRLGAIKITLSESERRRLWNGYRGGILGEWTGADPGNYLKITREWLVDIGQEPDWSLPIPIRGRRDAGSKKALSLLDTP
jgi:hypothetical protein